MNNYGQTVLLEQAPSRNQKAYSNLEHVCRGFDHRYPQLNEEGSA